jgi:hypothetical protein
MNSTFTAPVTLAKRDRMNPRLILYVALFAVIATLAVSSTLILAFNDPTQPEAPWPEQDGPCITPGK